MWSQHTSSTTAGIAAKLECTASKLSVIRTSGHARSCGTSTLAEYTQVTVKHTDIGSVHGSEYSDNVI